MLPLCQKWHASRNLKPLFETQKKRRGHKRAIIAIARMLLTAIYNNLKKKEPYNPELYKKADVIPVNREIAVEQALLLVKSQGFRVIPVTT